MGRTQDWFSNDGETFNSADDGGDGIDYITMDEIRDPVVIEGAMPMRVYERSSIQQWLREKATDPFTRQNFSQRCRLISVRDINPESRFNDSSTHPVVAPPREDQMVDVHPPNVYIPRAPVPPRAPLPSSNPAPPRAPLPRFNNYGGGLMEYIERLKQTGQWRYDLEMPVRPGEIVDYTSDNGGTVYMVIMDEYGNINRRRVVGGPGSSGYHPMLR